MGKDMLFVPLSVSSLTRDPLARRLWSVLGVVLFLAMQPPAMADEQPSTDDQTEAASVSQPGTPGADTDSTNDTTEKTDNRPITLIRLQYIQDVLSQKTMDRSELGERIEQANEQDKADLRKQADDLTYDILQLRRTLENIAIGGVDPNLFVDTQPEKKTNWREDIALIANPVLDSIKDLTEKPRKLKALNDDIAVYQQDLDTATQALANLQPELALEPGGDLGVSLARMKRVWTSRRDDSKSAIDIARFQIADLQGNQPLPATVIKAIVDFLTGRGLTLLIALLAALSVWFGVRFMLRGYRATISNADAPERRTRYRLAAYSVHALTSLLILIAIFVVFYERGDVLLLGLLILLIVGLALGIRHLLPQYIAEARLLLNIGAMREAERITYKGLPWRVESINMYTVLRNPELHGVLRIPLSELHGVISRPSGEDNWFPTSRGDSVLFPPDTLMEVIDQNPDTVELRSRGGQQLSIPTNDFYNKEMINLSRGQSFGATGTFGIDYGYQDISLSKVPKILRDAIRETLTASDLEPFIKDIRVELKEAGTSSIDYWLHVTMDNKAAKSYLRIKRMMQSACIQACSEQTWNIPYPHVSVVQRKTA